MAGIALSTGCCGLAACLLAGFDGFLRSTEMMSLTAAQINISQEGALIVLPLTKSGQRRGGPETVLIRDPQAVQLLWMACRTSRDATQPLSVLPPQTLRKWFSWALAQLHVSHMGFMPYSVRRGGATHAFSSCHNLGQILMQGRWEDSKTARIYITEGALFLTRNALPQEAVTECGHFVEVLRQFAALSAP
jgi:hypothetical protein